MNFEEVTEDNSDELGWDGCKEEENVIWGLCQELYLLTGYSRELLEDDRSGCIDVY